MNKLNKIGYNVANAKSFLRLGVWGLQFSQFSSVAQLCPTPCDPMSRSTPGLPVHHQLLEFTQTHVHVHEFAQTHDRVSDAIQPSFSFIPFSFCPQSFPASGCFPMNQFFTWGGRSIGVSASASVVPVNIQGWFPLGLSGLISLLSEGLSRIFSSTTVWKHQFFEFHWWFRW